MDLAVKQRLVGAAVLAALAVIVLPLIFNVHPARQVRITETAPPRPQLSPVTVPEPVAPVEPVHAPDRESVPVGDMYHLAGDKPAAVSAKEIADAGAIPPPEDSKPVAPKPAQAAAKPANAKPAVTVKPVPPAPVSQLDAGGVPQAWVVQVAAMSDHAKVTALVAQLKQKKYPAYSETTKTPIGETTRVFIGPKMDKNAAIRVKQAVDRDFGLQTMVVQFGPKA